MKTNEELNAIREQIANLETKLKELSEEELKEVGGGNAGGYIPVYDELTEKLANNFVHNIVLEETRYVSSKTSVSGKDMAKVGDGLPKQVMVPVTER